VDVGKISGNLPKQRKQRGDVNLRTSLLSVVPVSKSNRQQTWWWAVFGEH